MFGAAAHLTPNAFAREAQLRGPEAGIRFCPGSLYVHDYGANEQLLMAATVTSLQFLWRPLQVEPAPCNGARGWNERPASEPTAPSIGGDIQKHRVYQANVGVGWLHARVCQANVGVGGAPRGHVLSSPIGAQTLDARVPLRFLDIRSQKKVADTRHSVDRLRLDLALLDVLLMACVTGRTFVAMDTGHHFEEHGV